MIKNKMKLLQDIADGLKDKDHTKVGDLVIWFHGGTNGSNNFTLALAIDYLVNDVYFDERGNWSEATSASVDTI